MPDSAQRLTEPTAFQPLEDEGFEALYALASSLGAAGYRAGADEVLDRARTLHSETILRERGVDMARLATDSEYAEGVGRSCYNDWKRTAAVSALEHAGRDPARRLETQFVLGQALHYLARLREAEDVFRGMID